MANLFDLYDRTYATGISNANRASDLAVKLTDRSYEDANEKLITIQNDVFRKTGRDPNLGFGGDDPGIVSLDVMVQAYAPEIYKAAGNKVNKDGLEALTDAVNSMGLVQYATGNSTFITGIEEAGANEQGETLYRFDLGELESTDSGPNVRFRTLSPEDLDEKGDLVVTANQLGNIFEDYQYNVRRKMSPITGTEIAYSYYSDPQGLGNPTVTSKKVPPGQTDPHGTNYGGSSGDPNLDNQAYTGSNEFKGNVFQYLEEVGLNPKQRVQQVLEGGADELIKLTESEITALENEYGVPMRNADLMGRRDEILQIRAEKKAASDRLSDPDLNLSEKEKKELRQTIGRSTQREKRIMGDADRFLAGGVNVALSQAVSDDEKETAAIEAKLKRDPQLRRLQTRLRKQEELYGNISQEGRLKDEVLNKINSLKSDIEAREKAIDPRLLTATTKDKVNQEIANILENPNKTFKPIERLADLLKDSDYELSESTRAGLDEYINANLVQNSTKGGASLKLHPETKVDPNGNVISSPGLGKGRGSGRVRSQIDNRAFSILVALEANDKITGQQALNLMETMRYTGTLDTNMLQAMINDKSNLSAEQLKQIGSTLTDFNKIAKAEIDPIIENMDKYFISNDIEDLGMLFTDYNKIYRNLSVQQILGSADATGQINPVFSGAATILDQMNKKMLGLVAKESNDDTWISWLFSGGRIAEGQAFDPFNPNALRIKAVYADDASYSYSDLFDSNGNRKTGQPPVKEFKLQTLSGEDVGGTISYADAIKALEKLDAPGSNPTTLISRLEQQSFLY